MSVAVSSNSGVATVSSPVTVNAGSSTATFVVTAAAAVASDTTAMITATLNNNSRNFSISLTPAGVTQPAVSSVTCSPSSVTGGTNATCTVNLASAAPSGGTPVTLSTNNSDATPQSQVTVPAGLTSATFTVATTVVTSSQSVTISATSAGVTQTAVLTVQPAASLSAVTCSAGTIAPGATIICSVSLSGAAGSNGATVSLVSSNAQVTVPASVSIPAGQTSGSFSITAGASASGSATITATLGSATRTATLTIKASSSGVPTLVCSPTTIQTPGTSSCIFSLASPATSSTVIALASSSATVTVPNSITIATGLSSVNFTASASAVSSSTSVTISAMGQGVSQTLTLLAQTSSTVSVTAISCNPQTLVGGGSSNCQIMLSGAAPTGSGGIRLSSSSTQITVPALLQPAAGSTTVPFTATSTLINQDQPAVLIANYGASSAQTTLSLLGLKPTALVCPETLQSGLPLDCQVNLNSGQAAAGVPINLSATGSLVTVPSSALTQAGQASVSFQGSTNYVSSSQSVTLSAGLNGVAVQASVTLTPAPPVLTLPGLQTVVPGQTVSFTVTATDPAGLAFTLSVANLPPNSSFNTNTGVFTWAPQASQVGQYAVSFTATNTAQASATGKVTIEVLSTTPVVSALINAASLASMGCSPGAIATLLGTGFETQGAKAAEVSPLPTALNGLHVQVNGQDLPVFYVSEDQVNFQCPQAAPGASIALTVQSGTGASTPLSTTVQYSGPGIFTLNGSGDGQGAILVAGTANVAMSPTKGIASQPAPQGTYISIYATGLGPTTVNVAAGEPAPADPLAEVTAQVNVQVGGEPAQVSFAGLVPGYTGLYVVNAQLSGTTPIGPAIPVQITVQQPDGSTATSNTVTIAVAPAVN